MHVDSIHAFGCTSDLTQGTQKSINTRSNGEMICLNLEDADLSHMGHTKRMLVTGSNASVQTLQISLPEPVATRTVRSTGGNVKHLGGNMSQA